MQEAFFLWYLNTFVGATSEEWSNHWGNASLLLAEAEVVSSMALFSAYLVGPEWLLF